MSWPRQLGLDSGLRPARQPVRAGNPEIENRKSKFEKDEPGERSRISNFDLRVSNPWSGHWCDIFMAVEDGLPLDPEEVRAGCDEDTWLQEYCCQFISQASEWISPELFQQCVSSEASAEYPLTRLPSLGTLSPGRVGDRAAVGEGSFYAGWDIARNRDLSVIWISELVGDVTWTRGVIEMKNTPTPDQIREARSLMPQLQPPG